MPLRESRPTDAKDLGSIWLVSCVAVATATLRLSILAANAAVLWHVYGYEIAEREHLRITAVKPELLVSNGDILYGMNFFHYAVGVTLWLLCSVALLSLFYRYLLPVTFRREFGAHRTNAVGALGAVWAVGLFLSVLGWLPLGAAMAAAILSLVFAAKWAWRIQGVVQPRVARR